MQQIAEMASGLISCLKFTWEIPPDSGGGMAVLDTLCWMGVEEREEGTITEFIPENLRHHHKIKTRALKKVILFSFYKKPMANQCSNRAKSGMPENMRNAMTSAEIQRRLRNTSTDLPRSYLEETLRNYMDELKAGGYPTQWRKTTLEAGVKGFMKVWAKEKEGSGKINRPGHQGSIQSRYKKLNGKQSWFQDRVFKHKSEETLTGSNEGRKQVPKRKSRNPKMIEGVLFIPYTPGSKLKKELQEIDERFTSGKTSGRTKIVERLGKTIGEVLTNPYPWQNQHCGRQDCAPCQKKPGKCKSRNMVYKISCQECEKEKKVAHYIGETHRTFYDRSLEQVKNLRSKQESSALFKHWQICHPEMKEAPEFRCTCLKT